MCVGLHNNLHVYVLLWLTTFYTKVIMKSIYFFAVALDIIICRAERSEAEGFLESEFQQKAEILHDPPLPD